MVQTLLHGLNYCICIPQPQFVLTPNGQDLLACIVEPVRGVPSVPCFSTWLLNRLPQHFALVRIYVWRGDTEHKVSLYAGDLLLFISYPTASLPPVLSLLSEFGKLSGYKLNLNKSELFPINTEARAIDPSSFPFKIENNTFSYLGISVTRNHKDLIQENLITLLNQTKQILTQWSPLSMSLVGRINSIKMTILSKFLYLFQALPLFIPGSFFQLLNSVISSYLWRGKRPRLIKIHLQKTKPTGGLALPNFRFYYWAANLRCLAFWSSCYGQPDCPDWVAMELQSNDNLSILALLGSSLPLPSLRSIRNPVVKHSLKIWAQLRKHFGFHSFSLLSPIASNYLFKPSYQDSAFQEWHRKGIVRFKDVFIDNQARRNRTGKPSNCLGPRAGRGP